MRHSASSLLVLAATSLPFLFSQDSCYTFLVFRSFSHCLVRLARRKKVSYFLSLLSGYSGSSVTHFFRVVTGLMSWPDEVRFFSQLQSRLSTHLFLWTAYCFMQIIRFTDPLSIHRGACASSSPLSSLCLVCAAHHAVLSIKLQSL